MDSINNVIKGSFDIKSIIRTSAILWSDELGTTKTSTIQRKLVESVFVLDGNNEKTIEDLVTSILFYHKLNYSEEEVFDIINSSEDSFEIDNYRKTICLSNKRYETLKKRNTDINVIVTSFLQEYPHYDDMAPLEIVQKYLYLLLNSNIKAYLYLLKPNKYDAFQPNMISKDFSDEEITLINDFLAWENNEKNVLLMRLISFAIEYSLVSNNSDNSVYYESLHCKIFFLDSNIILRAIGVNGNFRKQRTRYLLKKCKETGQKFYITYYTKKEIEKSIDSHILELSNISYGKINPDLFDQSKCDSGFYEYYHKWRKDRQSKSLEVFRAFILSELDKLYGEFCIEIDYKSQINETQVKFAKKIDRCIKELKEIKREPNENIVKTDVLNLLSIEKKRGENNKGIQDTKYYLLTTDQKLQQWDVAYSEFQPLTLLPSHWMGLLLKFVSRTDNDYLSFISFLRMPSNNSILQPEELENVVAGISEMTEDFQTQSSIMKKMVETKFESILTKGKSSSIRENSIAFSKSFLENMYTQEISIRDDTIDKNSKEFSIKLKQKEQEIINAKRETLKYRIESISTKLSIFDEKLKRIEEKANGKRIQRIILSVIIFIAYFGLLFFLVYKMTWDKMEPITYFASLLFLGLSYLYIIVKGQSFNPVDFYSKEKIQEIIIKREDIDMNEYEDLKTEKKECTEKFRKLDNTNIYN